MRLYLGFFTQQVIKLKVRLKFELKYNVYFKIRVGVIDW